MAENRNSRRSSGDSKSFGEKKGESGKKVNKYKKEKSFSRNKALRQEKSSDSSKEGGYKSKGSGFKPKPFGKGKEGVSKDRGAFLRNDKYAEKKRGSFNKEGSDRTEKSYKKSSSEYSERKPYAKKEGGFEKKERSYDKEKSYDKSEKSFGKPKTEYGERKPFAKKEGSFEKRERSFDKDSKYSKSESAYGKPKSEFGERKAFVKKDGPFEKKREGFRGNKFRDDDSKEKRYKQEEFESKIDYKKSEAYGKFKDNKGKGSKKGKKEDDGLTRLNKYLANAGVASRRDADVLIQSGAVTVNGVVVTEMGFKVKSTDEIHYGGEAVRGERKVYLLLNKPKDCITTTDDPQERKTVMNLVKSACKERIYPVGRLDRNTTGLLLMTNDGEIAARLTHPKFNIKKVYQVSLTKGLKAEDMQQIMDGVELEDGFIKADEIAYVGEGKKEIGIEIHSGRNRIVRRLFEHLGYDILKLDRVAFAGLTKKDLPRGKYRFLEPKEVAFLRMIGG